MEHLLLAIAVFLISHLIPSYRPLRDRLMTRMGHRPFFIFYGLLSTGLFIWLFSAYFAAPFVEVWAFQEWMRWVPITVMPFVFLLLVCAFSQPNPFSIGIGAKGYDPSRPGIIALTRHPAIYALAIWSLAHMIPNGDLASLLLFGLLTLLSFSGPFSLNMKRRASLGAEKWHALAAGTADLPFLAIIQGRARFGLQNIGILRLLIALVLYGVMLVGHEHLFGVAPIYFE